ncbi:recombinase family protein [Nocardia sp. NBC_01730]|uniref:recombinase family protein n=1 Tax=Nocardia sp. NBC_01730 TaxID=2975998 RepID=UPI002E15AE26|nr:recombinase family protein [Nocardia sp. NBC_01730]
MRSTNDVAGVVVFRELFRWAPAIRNDRTLIEPFRVEYCRCSTDEQDVEIQTEQLLALGVPTERIFIDRGSSAPRARNGPDWTTRSPRSPRRPPP